MPVTTKDSATINNVNKLPESWFIERVGKKISVVREKKHPFEQMTISDISHARYLFKYAQNHLHDLFGDQATASALPNNLIDK